MFHFVLFVVSMSSDRSSRHSKIIGQFGEHLVCNFLSRSGFEATIVDHTGTDIIEYHEDSKARMGISVKSRTSKADCTARAVRLSKRKEEQDGFGKLRRACEWFGCKPWIAVYFEWDDCAKLYLTRLDHYKAMHVEEGKNASRWSMSEQRMSKLEADADVAYVELTFRKEHWSSLLKQ